MSIFVYLHSNVHYYPRPSHLSGKGHYSHISDSAISHSSDLMQHPQFSLFFGICTCCWPTLAWNRHTSLNEYMHLEQEAKMSSLVWICHQLNSSHNQQVVVALDLEYHHCTKSLPRRLGSQYSWMKWSWGGGAHCTCFFLKSHQLASAPLVNSVWGKYNWQTNASMTLMGASDRCSAQAVKVPVLCHCLGQVLPTL